MPVQPQLFPDSVPDSTPGAVRAETGAPPSFPAATSRQTTSSLDRTALDRTAGGLPIWMQRASLFVLVLFCVYLGVLVMVLPWWPRMWDQNLFLESRPGLSHLLHIGAVRGIISGLGAIDIWIGISEAIHYREIR